MRGLSLCKIKVSEEDGLHSSDKWNAAAHLERAIIEISYASAEMALCTNSQYLANMLSLVLKAKSMIEVACLALSNFDHHKEQYVD